MSAMAGTALSLYPYRYEDLGRWPHGVLQGALNASDMPARIDRSADVAQIAAWARQGLDRIGIRQARRDDTRTRAASVPAAYGTGEAQRAAAAELRAIWGSTRRRDTAVDYAWRLADALKRGTR